MLADVNDSTSMAELSDAEMELVSGGDTASDLMGTLFLRSSSDHKVKDGPGGGDQPDPP